ncbi:hypothetical protein SERLA73DRAFT_192093 [Serpula lacrymans var. lacrymans S7.3]|uniref:ER membrane protein complex subunit 7 beta-sandwich domain-containing protein n=2 Tax=Serpula lacrymans var. lacrymans TaxID=341189 RepID=F8QIY2_SERL3|nr:uncharacterized protein SERLADRAFT_459745 [Serpula lacrymans var. lacrymans S7.9]EGN91736.1 hypothetical protein SERLA73DRAFT_192093 [Serpula lacrymans var. lacrymans S7.3]EGO28875.1 hypothetical protein SERLADRAFT_459745 [Serpula lacrymans var. lacrymans S7.9]
MARTATLLVCLLLAITSVVSALDVHGRIQWNDLCPNFGALGASKVLLDAGRLSATVTQNGTFLMRDVVPGTYVLSVSSHDYIFDQLRLEVSDLDSPPKVWSYVLGTPLVSQSSVTLPYPVTFMARHKYKYFVPHESFNLMGMFQNPMMLIAVLTGVMMLGMPYLLKTLDPQMLEEVKDRHASLNGNSNSGQNGHKKSELSMLLNSDEEPKSSSVARLQAGTSPQPRNRSKANKRR